MPRVFIGLELPQAVKESLFSVSASLGESVKGARWVAKDNIHLTLKFLGSIPDEQVEPLAAALRAGAEGFHRLKFSIGDIGAFPSVMRARVLWAGVENGADELSRLSALIETSLEALGFPREQKPFKPHITIARLNPPKPVKEALGAASVPSIKGTTVTIEGVTIFQSHLTPAGSNYSTLRFIPLKP